MADVFYNPIRQDLRMIKGDTMSFAFQVQGLGSTEPDSVQFTCKETVEDEEPLFSVNLDNTISQRDYDSENDIYTYSVRIPPYKTETLSTGRYYYDLEIRVNNDVFTMMIGRLSLESDVTNLSVSPEPPTPSHESGDNELYPQEDIVVGTIKLYTEQTISDIGENILNINGSSEKITPAQMINSLQSIKAELDDISDAINIVKETQGDISLNNMAAEILMINPPWSPLKDGKTNLWVTVDDESLTVTISFTQTESNGVGIDFGDGSTEQTTTGSGSSRKEISHTYSEAGSYIIAIRSISGSYALGYSSSYRAISGSGLKSNTILQYAELASDTNSYCFEGCINLKKVAIQSDLTIGNYTFSRCSSLRLIDMAYTCTLGSYMIYYTTALEKLVVSSENISANALGYSFALREITLGNETQTIASGAFRDNSALESLTLPAGVTSLNNGAFTNCTNLRELKLEGRNPPTLNGALSIDKVYVPNSALADYQSAQYWSSCNLIGY